MSVFEMLLYLCGHVASRSHTAIEVFAKTPGKVCTHAFPLIFHNTRPKYFVFLQDGIEQVLLELCVMMWREQRVHERLRCLQMFSLFVSMMLQELAATQLGGAWAFVLRRVISTLLQLLQPQDR